MASIAEQIISNAQSFAQSTTDEAYNVVSDAQMQIAKAFDFEQPNVEIDETPKLPDPPATSIVAVTVHSFVKPQSPGNMGSLDSIPSQLTDGAPEFDVKPPTFKAPTAPSELAGFSEAPPVIGSITLPAFPTALLDLPLPPEVMEHQAPSKPGMTAPVAPMDETGGMPTAPGDQSNKFNSDVNVARVAISTLAQSYVDDMVDRYAPGHTAGMALLEDRLNKYIAGGTALPESVELAIYNRARHTNDKEAERVQVAAFADVAARGFTLPTGALNATLARARLEAASNNSKAANDIAIAQAELEQKNIQFAVTTSASLRTTVLGLINQWMQNIISINGQAIDTAKAILSAVIESYNLAVKAYSVKLDAWKAKITLFNSQIEYQLGLVKMYEAEIQALKLEYSVDQMKIDAYKARIDSINMLASVYKSQIDGVLGQATLEKTKLDLFEAKVKAYSAQVQAKQAQWQGFSAQVDGQKAEAQMFSVQASAFESRVQAFKAKIDAKSAEISAVANKNQATIEEFRAKMAKYVAEVQAEGSVVTTQNELEKFKGNQLLIQANINEAKYRADATYYKSESDRALTEAKLKADVALKGAVISAEKGRAVAEIAGKLADIYGGTAKAALAGMNSLGAVNMQE